MAYSVVGTSAPKEHAASMFRVEDIPVSAILKLEATDLSKMLVPIYQITLHLVPEGCNLFFFF
jgi:hypothetical protein